MIIIEILMLDAQSASNSKIRTHEKFRFWPKADPEIWKFAVVKASALEKSGH